MLDLRLRCYELRQCLHHKATSNSSTGRTALETHASTGLPGVESRAQLMVVRFPVQIKQTAETDEQFAIASIAVLVTLCLMTVFCFDLNGFSSLRVRPIRCLRSAFTRRSMHRTCPGDGDRQPQPER
jgi:hypothetical protein